MLNVKISKDSNKVKVIASGNSAEICSDITQLFHALIQGMKEHGEECDKEFKLLFLKGFDDGLIFDCSREDMAEMRETNRKIFEEEKGLGGLLNFLLDKLNELNKCLEDLDETK